MIQYIKCNIIPKLLINDRKLFEITVNEKYYRIKKLEIITDCEKLKEVWIHNAFHPNASDTPDEWDGNLDTTYIIPEKSKYCLPTYLQNVPFNDDILKRIIRSIEIINFDNSYFIDFQNIKIGAMLHG